MRDKVIAFIATVKEREQQLRMAIDSIIGQVDKIHVVLNWYNEIPDWISEKSKIHAHLNSENEYAHDSIWNLVDAENMVEKTNGQSSYYFTLDDDLNYPADYVEKLIICIEKYNRKAVVTVHAANISQPVESYFQCRNVYGFSCWVSEDEQVDQAACGTVAFHSSTIKPTLQDFPIVYMRDLWFSILCKKNNVPIITVSRNMNWITPLATTGDTVYNVSHSNKNLRELKNQVLKEKFLPLLFCNNSDDRYCLITDYGFNDMLMTKSLSTLAEVSGCNKIVFSDKVKNYGLNVLTQYVIPEEVTIGRMGSKVTSQYRFIKSLPDGSKVISADADLYYLKDPFTAFEQDFDIAVTTRPYKYQYPINGGVVMFRVNDKVKSFLSFLTSQVLSRTWKELVEWQALFKHEGNDWYIDQDILCCCWFCKDEILNKFGVKIIDVGPNYNYCPHADGPGTAIGKRLLMAAYNEKSVAVLHLKSRLKELLLDGMLG